MVDVHDDEDVGERFDLESIKVKTIGWFLLQLYTHE
jgi:hypothetical protein